jgi:chlorophyll synthase
LGNAACGLCYEGLAWVTGAAVMLNGALPSAEVFWLAGLYSVGTIGIMVLNDFKSIEGDRVMGVASLPVQLGPERAARVACWFMLVPQAVVVGLLINWGLPWAAPLIIVLMAAQLACIPRLLRDPRAQAPWYNATGVGLSVLGMMVCAVALRWL